MLFSNLQQQRVWWLVCFYGVAEVVWGFGESKILLFLNIENDFKCPIKACNEFKEQKWYFYVDRGVSVFDSAETLVLVDAQTLLWQRGNDIKATRNWLAEIWAELKLSDDDPQIGRFHHKLPTVVQSEQLWGFWLSSQGQHVLAVLPAGLGKSWIYQPGSLQHRRKWIAKGLIVYLLLAECLE